MAESGKNRIAGRVFVVTGAGNGIGRRVALELAVRGGTVIGADVNEVGLAETASLAGGRDLTTKVLDITDDDAVKAFAASVQATHGRVDGLFNIAGIPQPVEVIADCPDTRIRAIMEVNYFGSVSMTRAFLPYLEQRPDGAAVMLTSSLSAIAPFPGAAFYGASKAAVAMFGYALRQDLRGARSKVSVTTVLPGTIWTDIVRDTALSLGQSEKLAKGFAMPAEKAARKMIDATLRGRGRVVIGPDAHVFSGASRISTRLADRLSYLQVGTFVYRKR